MPVHIGQPCEFGRQLVIRELLKLLPGAVKNEPEAAVMYCFSRIGD
jgi:hypothetical protein